MPELVEPTHEEFLKRVEGFKLNVHKDDGVYRHIEMRHPDHFYGSFNIITWPGHLAYSGDMGDYVFERHTDMFSFFRRNKPEETGINPGYWSEKLQAVDKHTGAYEYSTRIFDEKIEDDFNSYWEFESPEEKKRSWEEIEWDLLGKPETQESAYNLGCNYECPITGQTFVDFWETNLMDYTYHYLFCCRAIPWAINEYDKYKLTA